MRIGPFHRPSWAAGAWRRQARIFLRGHRHRPARRREPQHAQRLPQRLRPFDNGRPAGPPRDILTGFLTPDERESYGRPVGITIGPDGSLLVADDVGNVIWRVTGAA